MGFLAVLSYPAGAAAGLSLAACIAYSLYALCELIEAHSQTARKVASRIGYASIVFLLLIHWTDQIPARLVAVCLFAQLVHLYLVRCNPTWPFSPATSPAGRAARRPVASGSHASHPVPAWVPYLAFTSTVVAHFFVAHTLSARRRRWTAHRLELQAGRTHSHLLPGGRLDWDLYDTPAAHRVAASNAPPAPLGGAETLTFFLCGVWAMPIIGFLGICAAMQVSLPLAS